MIFLQLRLLVLLLLLLNKPLAVICCCSSTTMMTLLAAVSTTTMIPFVTSSSGAQDDTGQAAVSSTTSATTAVATSPPTASSTNATQQRIFHFVFSEDDCRQGWFPNSLTSDSSSSTMKTTTKLRRNPQTTECSQAPLGIISGAPATSPKRATYISSSMLPHSSSNNTDRKSADEDVEDDDLTFVSSFANGSIDEDDTYIFKDISSLESGISFEIWFETAITTATTNTQNKFTQKDRVPSNLLRTILVVGRTKVKANVLKEEEYREAVDDDSVDGSVGDGDGGDGGRINNDDNDNNNNSDLSFDLTSGAAATTKTQASASAGEGGGDNSPPLDVCSQMEADLVLGTMVVGGVDDEEEEEFVMFYRTSSAFFAPCQMYRLGKLRGGKEPASKINHAAATTSTNGQNDEPGREKNYLKGNEGEEYGNDDTLTTTINSGRHLNHLVVSLTNNLQLFVLNGKAFPALNQPFSNKLEHWSDQYELYLFRHPFSSSFSSSDFSPPTKATGTTITTTTPTTVWMGTIYQLSIYSGSLSVSDAQSLLREGLYTSSPTTKSLYAVAETVHIMEDAEPMTKTTPMHDLNWYRTPPSVREAQPIHLKIGDLDAMVHDFIQDCFSSDILPNNDTGLVESSMVSPPPLLQIPKQQQPRRRYTYITALPTRGCLFLKGGKNLGCNATKNAHMDNVLFEVRGKFSPRVVYLPEFNQHSTASVIDSINGRELPSLANFSYCVSEKPIFSANHCRSAVVSVVVEPVNDPPIAIYKNTAMGPILVTEGALNAAVNPSAAAMPRRGISSKIELSGTDVDIDDFIQKIQITTPPSLGYLILSVGKFRRSDNLLHGVQLSDLNYTVPHGLEDRLFVQYIHDPLSYRRDTSGFASAATTTTTETEATTTAMPTYGNVIVKDNETTDSFQFRVADRHGQWSLKETIEIVIVSGIVAFAPESGPGVTELLRNETLFTLYGNDTSGYNRTMGFLIESPPPPNLGLLFSSISATGDGAVGVLRFHQQRMQPGDLSPHRNHFPYIQGATFKFMPSSHYCTKVAQGGLEAAPQVKFRAVAFDSDNETVVSMSDMCTFNISVVCQTKHVSFSLPMHVPPAISLTLQKAAEKSRETRAFLHGLHFEANHTKADELAQVSVHLGFELFITFDSSGWNDMVTPLDGRSSFQNGNVTFVARASDLNTIFENAFVQSFQEGEFQVSITLRYGNCGDEVFKTEQTNFSERESCHLIRHTTVVSFVDDGRNQDSSSFVDWDVLSAVAFTVSVGLIFYCYQIVAAKCIDMYNEDEDIPLWTQLKDPQSGYFYYLNNDTGEVTYQPPFGQEYIPWEDENAAE